MIEYVCFVNSHSGTTVYIPINNKAEIEEYRKNKQYFEFFQLRESF